MDARRVRTPTPPACVVDETQRSRPEDGPGEFAYPRNGADAESFIQTELLRLESYLKSEIGKHRMRAFEPGISGVDEYHRRCRAAATTGAGAVANNGTASNLEWYLGPGTKTRLSL
jgi:hypothetical protein